MTSRRAMPGYDQRLSRALQFVPGHVGGRVASAQPVRRRGGTIRQAVGATGAAPASGLVFLGYLPTSYNFGVGGMPPPPDPRIQPGPSSPTLTPGSAQVTMIAGWATGGVSFPSGWHTVASGTVSQMAWALAYTTHFDSPSMALSFPAWGMSDGSGVGIFTWYFGTSMDIGLGDPGPDFLYTLTATTPATATGATSQAMASPPSGVLYPWSVTADMRESGTAAWPAHDYSGTDEMNGAGAADPDPPFVRNLEVMHPCVSGSGNRDPLPGDGVTRSILGGSGSFVTLGLGWTP
jgi:hypothetical protein